jgi:adapter protein MecA 1/2
MERVSDTQMKFVLETFDLQERDIKINELNYQSDKTQRLFKEIMCLVQDEGEFVVDEAPLMFEAMRVGLDSLVVMVTKISSAAMGDGCCNMMPAAHSAARFKRPPLIAPTPDEETDEHIASHSVFSFAGLDMLAAGVARLPANFRGASSVYKLDGKFFLAIENETENLETTAQMEAALHEYGTKHISTSISRQYLLEHGEIVVNQQAVEKMRIYHGE